MFLLDTNIISDLVKNPGGRAATRFEQVESHEIATSVIVAGEIRFGLLQKGSANLTQRVEAVLGRIEVLPLVPDVSAMYGAIRLDLRSRGLPIGENDLWTAAQAHHLGAILVTDNEREFRRVDGLAVENWLAA
jgi:tRNA(fMet)-specific endonuclease VapC